MFSIYRLRRKGGRLISQNFFYFFFFSDFTHGVHVYCLFTYLISNLGGCLINYLFRSDFTLLILPFCWCFRIAFAKLLLF